MGIITAEEIERDFDEFCRENHVGKIEETAAYKDLEAKLEVRQMMAEQRARDQPRQMMDASDVAEALGISKSSAYKCIARLNKELEEAGYITVRGKISRAYFEERTYGINAG